MLKTNVVKRVYRITCQTPNGGVAVATVEAESACAALSRGIPKGWVALKVEAVQ